MTQLRSVHVAAAVCSFEYSYCPILEGFSLMKFYFSQLRRPGIIFLLLLGLVAFQFRGHPYVGRVLNRQVSMHDIGRTCVPGGVVSGVIRNTGNGWHALDDEGHAPINISRVESNWKQITVYFTFDAAKVQTFIISSDESFTASGVTAGASVGTDRARLAIAQQGIFGAGQVSPNWVHTGRFPSSNFWIFGTFEASCKD